MFVREEIVLTEKEAHLVDDAMTFFGICSEMSNGECGRIADEICDFINDFMEYAHIDLQTE